MENNKCKTKWYILSNKSDCGDLSIWKFEGTEKECFTKMKALVIGTASMANPDDIIQLILNDSDNTGYIAYSNGEREDFRMIARYAICEIEECDLIENIDTDRASNHLKLLNKEAVNSFMFITE